MALLGLVRANNLSDVTNKERAWDNLGQALLYGGNGDPYFDSVSLLLHGEGAPGGPVIDSSANPVTVSGYGGAVISSSQKKFGQSSLYDPSVNSAFVGTLGSKGLLGADNFTLEAFVYPTVNTLNPYERFLEFSGASNLLCIRIESGTYRWFAYINGATVGPFNSGVTALFNQQWTHHALVRNANTWNYYIDGTLCTSNTIAGSIDVEQAFLVGGGSSGEGFIGYFDEIRLTKRIARYNSNFTPPTAAFPDVLGNKIFTIKGKEVLALNDVKSVSARDFVFVKGTLYPVQPRLNAIAQSVTYGAALSNTLLLKQSPSSIGNYLVASGALNAEQLKTNGVPSASLSSSPFSGSSALFPLSIATMEMSSNFRLASVFSSGTIASPTIAMPVETNDFYLYAKTGQN